MCYAKCVLGNTEFKITNTKLCVTIVTFSTEDNVKVTKQLGERLQRPVYWNQYNKMEIKTREMDNKNPLRILLDASFQGIKRSFVLACNNNTVNDDNNPINNTNNRVQRDSHQDSIWPITTC